MARPTKQTPSAGTEGWDSIIDDMLDLILSAPFPIHENSGITEANLQANFPAASYDRCMVWVNHTVYGYTLYRSDGANWHPFDQAIRRVSRTVTGTATLTTAETSSIIFAAGSLPYTINLPLASTVKGRSFMFKTLVTGTLTIDANGAETIDGALTQTITAQYGVLRLYCDGTTWYVL